MSEWRSVRLGELIHVKHGFAFKGVHFAESGERLVLKPGNFEVGGGLRLRPGKDSYYTGSYPREFDLSPGDMVVVMTDLTQDAPILGAPAVVPAAPHMLHNQRLGLVQVKDGAEVDPLFLYYLLLSDTTRAQIRATATGATVRHTAPERIYRCQVTIPDPATQAAVCGVLGAIDDLILNNRRRIELLEDMARRIHHEWFVKFRFPGHQDVPFVDSALGPLPEGWSARALDDIVTVVKETVDPSALPPETHAIGLEHIPRKQITLDAWDVAAHQGSRKATFQKGDVLFGKIRPYFHKVCVAPLSGICSTDAIVIRPAELHWGQAVLAVSSDDFVAHATQTANGTKMPRADWQVLGKWKVAVPPRELAESFTGLVRDQLNLAETLMFENRRLTKLRDQLLPKLVTGQIDVSGLDLDAMMAEVVAG